MFILEVLTFLMMEVPKEPADLTQDNGLIIEHRRAVFIQNINLKDKLKLITFIQLMMVTLKSGLILKKILN